MKLLLIIFAVLSSSVFADYTTKGVKNANNKQQSNTSNEAKQTLEKAATVLAKKSKKKKKHVWLEPGVISKTIIIEGAPFTINRDQDRKHLIAKLYQKTGRGIIKPMHPFKPNAVETIAELEMISYIARLSDKKNDVVIVDARKPIWLILSGSLPGSINVPFHTFKKDKNFAIETMEDEFGVITKPDGKLDFSQAKTLAVYCNGNWCKMSPELIWALLDYGYPAEKIKYYRGGMQAWQLLGLTVVE